MTACARISCASGCAAVGCDATGTVVSCLSSVSRLSCVSCVSCRPSRPGISCRASRSCGSAYRCRTSRCALSSIAGRSCGPGGSGGAEGRSRGASSRWTGEIRVGCCTAHEGQNHRGQEHRAWTSVGVPAKRIRHRYNAEQAPNQDNSWPSRSYSICDNEVSWCVGLCLGSARTRAP